MVSKITYLDALNSSSIYPPLVNDQNNNNRSNDGVTIDDGRQFMFGISFGVHDKPFDIQT